MKHKIVSQNKIDVDAVYSHRKGPLALFEKGFRRYRTAFHIFMLMPLYLVAAVLVGTALTPGLWLYQSVAPLISNWPLFFKLIGMGTLLAMGYIMYGLMMIVLISTFNRIFKFRLKEWRGPYYSMESIPWYIHNGTTYLLRYTFLEFVTPTPLNLLFYRWMGMKIGQGTVINTTHISDPSLVTMGEKVTIGGSVTIVGHYGQGGFLILSPVEIGDRATIGLRASIMGGAKIGAGAKILPHSVVMPKTVIPAGEVWGGVPAKKISSIRKQRKAS